MSEEYFATRVARMILAGLPVPREAGVYDLRAGRRKAIDLAIRAVVEARTAEEQRTARECLTRILGRDA